MTITTRHIAILLAISPTCFAGIQFAIPIINQSPYTVEVDLTDTSSSNCVKAHPDSNWVRSYMDTYTSTSLRTDYGVDYADLDPYLQYFKSQYNVSDLSQGDMIQIGQTGMINPSIPDSSSAPFLVVSGEIDGGLFDGCIGSHSRQKIQLNVNGVVTNFMLEDPPKSHWTVTKSSPDPTIGEIVVDIGSGGHANVETIITETLDVLVSLITIYSAIYDFYIASLREALAVTTRIPAISNQLEQIALIYRVRGALTLSVTTVGGLVLVRMDPFDLGSSPDTLPDETSSPETPILGFDGVISQSNPDDRICCTLGENIWENYDCKVVSVALVIQADGSPVLVPTPNLYRAWKS